MNSAAELFFWFFLLFPKISLSSHILHVSLLILLHNYMLLQNLLLIHIMTLKKISFEFKNIRIITLRLRYQIYWWESRLGNFWLNWFRNPSMEWILWCTSLLKTDSLCSNLLFLFLSKIFFAVYFKPVRSEFTKRMLVS